MSSKAPKKPSQPPKSIGKQTTLFGFFSKTTPTTTPASTSATKRVEARPAAPLTPLPSSEVGDEETPVKLHGKPNEKTVGGLRTPVTPAIENAGEDMEIETLSPRTGSRKVHSIAQSKLNELETSCY